MPSADVELPELIRRLREHDPAAVADLVLRYEADIRRIARVRLARFGLRHIVDSEDIAQSVFGRFFARLGAGGLEFESPEKILHLLAVIAANRVNSHARRERRMVRPAANGDDSAAGPPEPADTRPVAERVVAARDELDWLLNALDSEERGLLLARLDGKAWAELAEQHGVEADALRKRLSRALDGLGRRLGQND